MEMKIKSQVQFNDDLSQRSNIVSGDSLSNSFAKIHHDLNDYEIAANIAANDRPKNLLYIHDILSDSVSTATEEILGYPLEAGTYVYSAEIYTVQNPSVANVTKIEFLGSDGNTVVGTCNIACDTKKEEHINVTLSDEAYYIKYYRDTYSSETVGYLKTSKQMICLPNVYAAFPEYTMYAPSLGETFLEVEDSVKTYDVQDTYNSSSYKAISGKGVAAALGTLDVSSVGGTGKVISAISETGGKISATETTMDTTPTANSTVPVTSGGVAASQAVQETEIGIVANAGAKNYCPYNNLTADSAKTIIDKQPINLPAGTYVLSCAVTASTNSIAVRLLKDDTSLWNKTISNTGGLITEELTITDNANQITLYTGVANTISNIMICSAAISDASYQPYAKTNRELTVENASQQSEINYAVNTGAKNFAVPFDPISTSDIIVTRNANDSYTFACTNVSENRIIRVANIGDMPSGTYKISGVTGGSSSTYMLGLYNTSSTAVKYQHTNSEESYTGNVTGFSLRVRVISGYSGTFTVYPMIRPASITDSTFVPYAKTNRELTVAEEEDRAALVAQVDGGAKNVLGFDCVGRSGTYSTTYTISGITYTVDQDGTVSLSGTAGTGGSYVMLGLNQSPVSALPFCDGTHIISGTTTKVNVRARANSVTDYLVSDNGNGAVLTTTSYTDTIFVSLRVEEGVSVNGEIVKPMICSQEDYAISQKSVPYCPTNRELYEMIQELQNGGIVNLVYGMGEEIPNNSDLDDYKTPGTFYVLNNTNASTIANKPIGGSGFRLIVSFTSATNRQRQEFYKPNTPDVIYIRNIGTDGNWSGWYQFNGTAVT